MTVKDIYNIIDKIAPFSNQCDFDNAGLLLGGENANVSGITVSLDCTKSAVDFAIKNNCNLIVTHHPVIFEPLKSITEQDIVFTAIKNGISVISAHTNLDFSSGGINDTLCELLGLQNVRKYGEIKPEIFELRVGEITPTEPLEYAKALKEFFLVPIKFVSGNKKIKHVAICSGSGGDLIDLAIDSGADALITADIKHHQFLDAEQKGISLYECGHFNTEDIIIEPLAEKLKEKTNLNVFCHHGAEIKYV